MSVAIVSLVSGPYPKTRVEVSNRVVAYEPKDAPLSERRRLELGKFLRTRGPAVARRLRMPAGLRGAPLALRREELALLAGVGVTWYTWLEQGRRST